MFKYVLTSLKGYKLSFLKSDIIAGVVVAALSIPVAMGYAGVAGLPPVYGLYASMLPVLGYILFASSPQLIFGTDASACAITGSVIAGMGIMAGSDDAVSAAALLSFFTALFLLLFAILRLGRFADYISMPVMSGFMSGTALSIMLSQVPKIFGIPSGGNNFFDSIVAIVTGIGKTNLISLAIGAVTVALVLVGRKFLPKLPMGLIVMVLGTALCALLRLDEQGVVVVGDIPRGLPPISLPDFFGPTGISAAIGSGLLIAVVIFADSLMSSRSFATRNHYKLDNNREIFAFGVSNLIASLSNCSPTSASVSRTAASEQFKGKTQMVSVVSVVVIGLVVMFFSGLLYYMPQPVLGGIVFAALLPVVDILVIRSLWRQTRNEAFIWLISAAGVLVVGVLFGVFIGVILSFFDVILRITNPPQAYLGKIEGRSGYFDQKNHKQAKAIPDVVIYRFSARLFFANVAIFKTGVKKAVEVNQPQAVIIDASGINSIDATAAEEISALLEWLDGQEVACYFAGQIDALNDQFEDFGLGSLREDGRIQKTVDDALEACAAVE